MKITMELPDNTAVLFTSIIVNEEDAYYAKAVTFANESLQDGNTIKIDLEKDV